MMVCPEFVYEELKQKSTKEVLSAIRGFKQTIGRLKNKIEKERFFPSEVIICPSDDVILSCTRDYLIKAYQLLAERGEDYKYSKNEEQSIEFDDNIKNIKLIKLRIGEWCCPKFYEFEIQNERVKFKTLSILKENQSEVLSVESLFYGLERLHLGEWKHYYKPDRFGVCILDGIQWELEIEYKNGKKKSWGGSNDYPYNFEELLSLLGVENIYEDYYQEEEDND